MVKKYFFLGCLLFAGMSFYCPIPTSIADTLSEIGMKLSKQQTKYVANTLDEAKTEKLVIYDDKFDCVTFVEYCLGNALNQHLPDRPSVASCITQLRYRDGKMDGYGSRIHYFTEWIQQVDEYGYGKDITKQLGGTITSKKIDFMSTHTKLYPKLDKVSLSIIKKSEKNISDNQRYIINKSNIQKIEKQLNNGDIIAIATSIEGLDYSHTGIIYVDQNNERKLLHASQTKERVVVTDESIAEYLAKHPKMTGISVLRIE